MYEGDPRTKTSALNAERALYDTFSPTDVCRVPFRTSRLRLELDTSAETGDSDWNYIDYVRLFGWKYQQPGLINTPVSSVVYVPDDHANGEDSFKFAASDCLGNRKRVSTTGTMKIMITATNDAHARKTSSALPDPTQLHFNPRFSIPPQAQCARGLN